MATITDADCFEATGLVYRRWALEYDLLKQTMAERDDGSKDWTAFHSERFKRHTADELKWRLLRDRLIAACPRLID